MKRFKSILVQVDSSRGTQPALDHAIAFAATNQAKLKIVDVVPDFSWPARMTLKDADKLRALLADQKRRRLAEIAEQIADRKIDVQSKVLMGRSSVQMILEVQRDHHDLVIRETKGVQSRRAGFLGTTSLQLLRQCPSAVWLIKPEQPSRFEHVLAAVDATAHDEPHGILNVAILDIASSIAEASKCRFDVVYAWSIYGENILREHLKPGEFEELERTATTESEQAMDALLSRYGLSVGMENVHLLRGDASYEIPQFVVKEKIDLLVMGTVARTGIAGWFIGNTAERIFDKVSCSLLALKPLDFQSGVKE
jgi:universal stress protein E